MKIENLPFLAFLQIGPCKKKKSMNVRKKKKTCRAYKHVVSVLCGAAIQCEPSVMNGYDKDGRSQDLRTVPTVTELHGKFNFGGRIHAVPRPMEFDAKIEGSVKNLRVQWLSDEQIITTSTHSMCGNACHRLFNCTETVFYHWLRVSTHTPLSQMHTSRRLKIAPKGTIHASGSKTNSFSRIPN